jgi:1-acyl-sn-glycerol-3-phosphate acyltransferase
LGRGAIRDDVMPEPKISPTIAWGFRHYVRYYLRRNLSAIRIAKGNSPQLDPTKPVICYINHPSWWDPLIVMTVNDHLFQGRNFFAPMDARALDSYPVFKKLGYFGIDMQSKDGARSFLDITRSLLANPRNTLWITPGGKFSDVREKTEFEPGLAHLAANLTEVTLIPMAIELVYWEERTPEVLVEFGEIETSSNSVSKDEWRALLEQRLADAQASLAAKSLSRNYAAFDSLLDGTGGIGGFYDGVRWARAKLSGKPYQSRHRDACDSESMG